MAVVKAFEPRIGHDLLHREAEDRTCAYRVEQGQRGGEGHQACSDTSRPVPSRAMPLLLPATQRIATLVHGRGSPVTGAIGGAS